MKKMIRMLSLSALLMVAMQAAIPQQRDTKQLGFGGGPIPLCDPDDPTCTIW